jgi:hypothetical protein
MQTSFVEVVHVGGDGSGSGQQQQPQAQTTTTTTTTHSGSSRPGSVTGGRTFNSIYTDPGQCKVKYYYTFSILMSFS